MFSKDSIFFSTIRSFCVALATAMGAVLGLFGIIFVLGTFAGQDYLPTRSEMTIVPDAYGNRDLLPSNSPAVLRLDIHGVIGLDDLTADKIQNILLDSREDMLRNDRVKAVLLHLDTPGGTVTDADAIYRALLRYKATYKVPVYAYVDGLCASGGMYIASAADKIYASDVSVIGSVGVIMGPNFNFSDLMAKWGISALTLTEGKDKDELNPFRPWKPDESAPLQSVIACMYDRFVSVVTAGRPKLNREKLINEYGAHIFASKEAEALGYIDVAASNYEETLSALTTAAGLTESAAYQVVQLSAPQPLLKNLTSALSPSGKIVHTVEFGAFNSQLAGKPLYLYQP